VWLTLLSPICRSQKVVVMQGGSMSVCGEKHTLANFTSLHMISSHFGSYEPLIR
jgi:hypothetical protein